MYDRWHVNLRCCYILYGSKQHSKLLCPYREWLKKNEMHLELWFFPTFFASEWVSFVWFTTHYQYQFPSYYVYVIKYLGQSGNHAFCFLILKLYIRLKNCIKHGVHIWARSISIFKCCQCQHGDKQNKCEMSLYPKVYRF